MDLKELRLKTSASHWPCEVHSTSKLSIKSISLFACVSACHETVYRVCVCVTVLVVASLFGALQCLFSEQQQGANGTALLV